MSDFLQNRREAFVRAFFGAFSQKPLSSRFSDFLGKEEKYQHPPENVSEEYLQKAKKWGNMLRFLPFVRGVAVVNTVSFGVASLPSDIDLFIVTAPGKIWTARFFVTAFFSLFSLRRTKHSVAGKFCLSFFVDETVTDVSAIKLPFDPYLAVWCAGMIPLFGEKYFSQFHKKNEQWIEEESSLPILWKDTLQKENFSFLQKFLEGVFCWTERALRYFWQSRTLAKKALLKNDSGTVVSDNILKFHDDDKRTEWAEKLQTFEQEKKIS